MSKKVKRKRKKFYDHVKYWNTCMKKSRTIRGYGLCSDALRGHLNKKLLDLFEPTDNDWKWLKWEEKNTIYWGSDSNLCEWGEFTELRQTIVLFMAAMKKQL